MASFTATSQLPECWGHRGASATFPENSIASFEAAIRDGAHGIESDVHVSLDGVVIMFHDPDLARTTGSPGLIRERNWHGENGMEHCRTIKEPKQPIPTFAETISLLMRPENRHVKFNVDVKVQNDPPRLFKLMHEIISAQEDWRVNLAPRIILGLWHSSFIVPAKKQLPYVTMSHIGLSLEIAREYFWDSCEVFSMLFSSLTTSEGARFRQDVARAGKRIMVWTVNDPLQMVEAVRWNVSVILTDRTRVWLDLRNRLSSNPTTPNEYGRTFLWTSPLYYRPTHILFGFLNRKYLEKAAGPFQKVDLTSKAALAGDEPDSVPGLITTSTEYEHEVIPVAVSAAA